MKCSEIGNMQLIFTLCYKLHFKGGQIQWRKWYEAGCNTQGANSEYNHI
jgi:hypothetical protein